MYMYSQCAARLHTARDNRLCTKRVVLHQYACTTIHSISRAHFQPSTILKCIKDIAASDKLKVFLGTEIVRGKLDECGDGGLHCFNISIALLAQSHGLTAINRRQPKH